MHLPDHFNLFILCWIIVGIGAGLYLLRREAPYGRFSNERWGPMIPNRWGWFLMELTVMVSFGWKIPFKSFHWASPAGLMIGLFFLHYIHRSLIYPLMIRTRGKKMPLVIMIAAMVFNMVNGELLGSWFADWNRYPLSWLISPYFIIGIGLFLTGMAINMSADYKLISLRGKGETGYKLPVNGLFNYVSSPNLLGEIIEWGGFALLTWSLPALAFFIWTCANLLPRAISNHRWYHSQFPGYPAERRILVPFIW